LRTRDGQAFHELRHRVFAVGSDQSAKAANRLACARQIAIDAIVPRLCPSLVEVAQRGLFLLMVGKRVVAVVKRLGGSWKLNRSASAVPDGTSNGRGLDVAQARLATSLRRVNGVE